MKKAERNASLVPFLLVRNLLHRIVQIFQRRSISVVSNYPWNNEVFCEEKLQLTSYINLIES